MAEELNDIEYAQMLVEGNATCFWHWLPEKASAEEFDNHLQDAMWRVVKQALNERAGMALPDERPAQT